jgi:hypothetical protein
LERCRIDKHPHFVFLCGGALHNGSNPDFVKSAREAFMRHKARFDGSPLWKRLLIAEDIFKKFPEEEYRDLLSFEQDLAQLSSLIVIFLESAGSFAELGSFVAMPEVRRKVAVVIAEKYSRNQSFVWKGPVAHLEHNPSDLENRVYIYPWNPDAEASTAETFFEDSESLVDQLEDCLKTVKHTSSLEIDNNLHQMLLIVEFLNVTRIGLVTDVVDFLKILGAPEDSCRLDKVKGRLALLSCLELISEKQYGHTRYFIGTGNEKWINFGYKAESLIRDESRWSSIFAEKRLDPENKQKFLALKSWMKSNEKRDELQPN